MGSISSGKSSVYNEKKVKLYFLIDSVTNILLVSNQDLTHRSTATQWFGNTIPRNSRIP